MSGPRTPDERRKALERMADDFGALLAEILFAELMTGAVDEFCLPEVDSTHATDRTTNAGPEGPATDDPTR